MNLTQQLRGEYQQLWNSCVARPQRAATIDALADRIAKNKRRYEAAGKPLGVPWHVVGIIHMLESSGSFATHLHNGDPLTARTVHVPKGRPAKGSPPFTWEASAADALALQGLDKWKDWSVPGTLYVFERYNGFGYRPRGIHSPYLWSFSNHYARGKYVKDGVWSQTAVSQQCGAAVLLRRLAERGLVALDGKPPQRGPVLRYAPKTKSEEGKRLQEFLNRFPGIAVRVDGELGQKSSDAFRKLTGHYLAGDPRAKK